MSIPRRTARARTVLTIVSALITAAPTLRAQDQPNLVAPRLVAPVEPVYPSEERAAAREARVVLSLTLDETGRVTHASVTSSAGPHFDAAALSAAERLVFAPAMRDERPIASRIPFTFHFAPAIEPAAVERASTGVLKGIVRAPTEEPWVGASLTLAVTSGPTLHAVTDADGAFSFAAVPAGVHHVVLSAPGMQSFAADELVERASVTEVVYRPSREASSDLDIEVRGERPARESTRRVLQAAELARLPGTNGDALHAVENLPGVARTNGISGNLVVRGSAPFDTAVFVDGTWLTSAFHFGGVTSIIPTELLERLDFYPGNFSVEYGRQMGGVIDVGVRSPRKDRIGGLLQFDLLDGRVLMEGPIDGATRFAVAARRSWIDAWLGPLSRSGGGDGYRTAPVYYDYQAVIERDLSRSTTARLLFFGSDDRLALTLTSPDASDPIAGGDLAAHDSALRLQARIDTRWSDAVKWSNMVSWGREQNQFMLGGIAVDNKFHIFNARSDVRAKIAPGLSGVIGFDGWGGLYQVDVLAPPKPPEGQVGGPAFGSPLRHLRADGGVVRPAAYALLDVAVLDRIKLMPGLRVDYAGDIHRWSIDPRFTARADLTDGFPRTTLKGGVGVFHQPPQPQESIAPFGTPEIRPNRAVHVTLGVEQELSRHVEVSVEAFHKRFTDLVTTSTSESASGNSYDNAGSGRAYGSEVLLRWKPGGRFFGWLAYTLSRSERRTSPNAPLELFQFDQTHISNVVASYDLGRGWTAGARFRAVSGELYTPYLGGVLDLDAGAYAPIASPKTNSARLGTFHSLDLRIDKTWTFAAWKLSAYADVRNVYNHRNPEAVAYNYNYTQSQTVAGFPILPIVGLRGEL